MNKLSTKIAIRPTHIHPPSKLVKPQRTEPLTKEEGEKIKIKKSMENLLMKIKSHLES